LASEFHEYVSQLPFGPLAVLALFLAALLEYVFPPFPGDVVVLTGAFLVGAAHWDPLAVLLSINAGTVVGILADYGFGRFVARRDARWRARWRVWARVGRALDAVLPLFARHPNFYLVINRFLPSVRALFFVAAGMVRVPLVAVLLLGVLSGFAWTGLLFLVGWWIGEDWDRLASAFARYQFATWTLVAVVVAVVVLRLWRRTRTGRRTVVAGGEPERAERDERAESS
jgi:membrane-associated protein